MECSEMEPSELKVFEETTGNNIFNENDKYVVPLYQRAYAWSEDEINQLIEDISGNQSEKYYIGSLIVYKRPDAFEVIDGQQRLTTLFLLLSHLNVEMKQNLFFDCRNRSNLTLKKFVERNDKNILNEADREESLFAGKEIIKNKFILDKINTGDFKRKLSKVVLYRIEVPENTDLNRYFEIMNTRGEQLEQHDVLKAKFMELIDNTNVRNIFAEIWEACSDMTGYIPMNMQKSLREEIFGKRNWDDFPEFEKYINSLNLENKKNSKQENDDFDNKLEAILNSRPEDFKPDAFSKEGEKIRFEAPISFTYFLLHVLRIYVASNTLNIKLSSLMEDIKLLEEYKELFKIKSKDKNFSISFMDCLLRCRYLLDFYIIKREYSEENKDGDWSLKWLNKSKEDTAYYTEAFDLKHNLMLQATMRVSFTSPKIMHWITESLKWLYERGSNWTTDEEYSIKLKSIIKDSVNANLFDKDGYESLGVETPHIAFNYLDYLLWEEDQKKQKKYTDFSFEYRTSVEHWFPQHPSEGTFQKWEQAEVDHFGNLCLIQRNVNSKFSNLEPHSKKTTFKEMISKGSLKLRLMAEKTTENVDWKNVYEGFGEEMLNKLADACGFDRSK